MAADDPVALDLYVKNVDTLIVKVFEINTQNFYRENLNEIGPDINLDGLVANEEKTYTYKEPPLRRVRRHFEFPLLNHRGVYVIDFIGNGKASRALIRKGKLQFLVRTSVAGQIFTIFDEQNKPQPEAVLWLAGTLYSPDKDGTIAVPFSNAPGRQPLVMSLGGFSSLGHVEQEAENYHLDAAMYVDREELIGRRKAQLIVRPQLVGQRHAHLAQVAGRRAAGDHVDRFGQRRQHQRSARFQVVRRSRDGLRIPGAAAAGEDPIHAQGQDSELQPQSKSRSGGRAGVFDQRNRSDRKTEDLHFARVGDNYVIDLLGKTGEAEAGSAGAVHAEDARFHAAGVRVAGDRRQGRSESWAAAGRVTVTATIRRACRTAWAILHDDHTYPSTIQGEADAPVEVPYMGDKAKPDRAELSLVGIARRAVRRRSVREHLASRTACCRSKNFRRAIIRCCSKTAGRQIRIRLTEGERRGAYVMGNYRKLEVRNTTGRCKCGRWK